MRVLAIDPGSRRIGLAISDESGLIAMPLVALTVSGAGQVVEKLAAEAARLSAERLVVGLPLRLDGRESDAARAARKLSSKLAEASGLPVVLWDERLSTKAAERTLREGGDLLMKVFQGEGYEALVKQARERFETVSVRKPKASRPRSREVYLLARNHRA